MYLFPLIQKPAIKHTGVFPTEIFANTHTQTHTHTHTCTHTHTHTCTYTQHTRTHESIYAWYIYSCVYRVLQCVAVCCSVLQSVAVCCSVLQSVAVCCSVLQYTLHASFAPDPKTATEYTGVLPTWIFFFARNVRRYSTTLRIEPRKLKKCIGKFINICLRPKIRVSFQRYVQ